MGTADVVHPIDTGRAAPTGSASYGWLAAFAACVGAACFALGLDVLSVAQRPHLGAIHLAAAAAAPVGFLLARRRRRDAALIRLGLRLRRRPSRDAAMMALLAFAVAAGVALLVLQSVPLSADESAYVLQAGMFADGRLWEAASPIETYVSQPWILAADGRLVSQYPPGWPAILAAARTAGAPLALVNPALGALVVLATWRFAERRHGRDVAFAAAAMLTGSGFFLFNAASFFNGTATALFGVLFAGAAASFSERANLRAALSAGLWLSALANLRHFDAALFAVPAAVGALRGGGIRRWRLAPAALLGAAPGIALLLWYYWRITGSPFTTAQSLGGSDNVLLGPRWSALQATRLLADRVLELSEWVSPVFPAALAAALVLKVRAGGLRFFDLYGPVFLAGYWLFWADGGHRWGPRYILPALPFMAVAVAERAVSGLRGGGTRFARLAAVSIVVAVVQLPFLAARGRQMIDQTQDLARQVRAAGLRDAVVVAVSGTGAIWESAPADLARNGLRLDGDVVFAHGPIGAGGLRSTQPPEETVAALRAFFPERSVWLYERHDGDARGRLVQAWPPG